MIKVLYFIFIIGLMFTYSSKLRGFTYGSMTIDELQRILDNDASLTQEQTIELEQLILKKWEADKSPTKPYLHHLSVLPRTLEEAVDVILEDMSPENQRLLKTTTKPDLIKFHHGWGTGIRNAFRLWGGNKPLIKSICSSNCHPDTASMKIIEAVWSKLHESEKNR